MMKHEVSVQSRGRASGSHCTVGTEKGCKEDKNESIAMGVVTEGFLEEAAFTL